MKMKKFNKDLFWSVLVISFFFLSTNSYAQEETGINVQKAHGSTVETVNVANYADKDEYNSARSQAVSATTAVSNAIVFIAPEITSNYEEIKASSTITPDMKRGIYGMTTDGVYALYQSQPTINVYAHLAEEWVPGYQSDTGVYAGLTTTGYDSGYTELVNTGISGLWSQVRNITYIFFILIMIIVGFMIMFRSKIGGQTLVTLGNTLPNIILALIGVTFSFAIAGVLIDIGGVIMVIVVNLYESVSSNEYMVTLESFGSIFKTIMPGGIEGVFDSGKGGLFAIFGGGETILALLGAKFAIPAALAGAFPAGVAGLFSILGGMGIVGLVIVLVIIGVVAVGAFKVFLTLIKAYVGIIIGVITGPFQIAMSAIPGKGAGFINWMKSIMRNVLVYPVTFAILNLPGVIYSLKGGELSLPGPDKLTLAQSTGQIDQSQDLMSGLLVFILQIFVLFAASKADKYVAAILPPTTSKAGGDATMAAKAALNQIPLVGSLFK